MLKCTNTYLPQKCLCCGCMSGGCWYSSGWGLKWKKNDLLSPTKTMARSARPDSTSQTGQFHSTKSFTNARQIVFPRGIKPTQKPNRTSIISILIRVWDTAECYIDSLVTMHMGNIRTWAPRINHKNSGNIEKVHLSIPEGNSLDGLFLGVCGSCLYHQIARWSSCLSTKLAPTIHPRRLGLNRILSTMVIAHLSMLNESSMLEVSLFSSNHNHQHQQ